MKPRISIRGMLIVWLLLSPGIAAAAPVTTTFEVVATSGPLAGTSSTGSFTFDSRHIVFDDFVFALDLFDDLVFSWNGIDYTTANATSAILEFDADGTLISFLFGSDCVSFIPGTAGCQISAGTNDWWVRNGPDGFYYALPNIRPGIWQGDVTFDTPPGPGPPGPPPVPEPSSFGLLGIAISAGMFAGAAKSRRRAPAAGN